MTRRARALHLNNPADATCAARALASGAVVGHGLGNFYAISPPPNGGGPLRLDVGLFDWSRLPDGLSSQTATAIMERLIGLGPVGFRGPAGAHLPPHLTTSDAGIRTAQLIAPGYICPSHEWLAHATELLRVEVLHIPAEPDFVVLEHADEYLARVNSPVHPPISITILDFHKHGGPDENGRPRLIVERCSSLPVSSVRAIAAEFGFGVELGPKAVNRLTLRVYDAQPSADKPSADMSNGGTLLGLPVRYQPWSLARRAIQTRAG